MRGREIGTHQGACFFTVGQRKGLGVAAGEPLYVVRIDVSSNTVVLGDRAAASSAGMVVSSPHWVRGVPPESPFQCLVQIRHRHAPAGCVTSIHPDGTLHVIFSEPQYGVAPGQAAVFYDREILLGGGWIESSF